MLLAVEPRAPGAISAKSNCDSSTLSIIPEEEYTGMSAKLANLYIVFILILSWTVAVRADLAQRIDSIVEKQKGVHYSIHVIKADSGTTVYDHRANDLMIPASNMKVVTTAAALRYLGADFEYKTKVGLCDSTLMVVGSGDPLLGDPRLDEKYERETGWIFADIAAKLKAKRITSVNDIIVDTTIFDDERVHSAWPEDQLNRWYEAEVSGLNYNDNCIDIIAEKINGMVSVSLRPSTNFVTLLNKIKPTSAGPSAVAAYRNKQPNKLTLTGDVSKKATLADIAIERPAGFFGFLLAEHLAAKGIRAKGHLLEKELEVRDNCDLLAVYTTSMADCLMRCNKNSLGLVAEALLKTIAAHSSPAKKNGSWAKGRELVGAFLMELGLDESQFYVDDGSGLSRQNELAARTLTTVLRHLYKSSNWDLYRDSLSVGGIDGTLEKHFREGKYKGRIRGKTGYITGVKSLSGICETDRGEYIFCILGNNGPSRSAINSIAQAIIDEYEVEAPKSTEPNLPDSNDS